MNFSIFYDFFTCTPPLGDLERQTKPRPTPLTKPQVKTQILILIFLKIFWALKLGGILQNFTLYRSKTLRIFRNFFKTRSRNFPQNLEEEEEEFFPE